MLRYCQLIKTDSIPLSARLGSQEVKMDNAKFDPTFTSTVINATGPKASARTREVFTSLFKHVHDFAREVELTIEEWQLGMQFLDEVGHMYFTSDKKRHEMHRISDVIGLERFVHSTAATRLTQVLALWMKLLTSTFPNREPPRQAVQSWAPFGRQMHHFASVETA
jgi:hypothetical protein